MVKGLSMLDGYRSCITALLGVVKVVRAVKMDVSLGRVGRSFLIGQGRG